ncbi:hypothetical protein XAC3615_14230006 [Xanthomonas citri pv. citri]|nr:hypothetical protein XAC3615_14230006 [Xanthomonas citri pv. citri]
MCGVLRVASDSVGLGRGRRFRDATAEPERALWFLRRVGVIGGGEGVGRQKRRNEKEEQDKSVCGMWVLNYYFY